MSNVKLENMKRRITALLDRAEHPNTNEHEAASAREKAEELMKAHRIERAMLHLKGHDERRFEVKKFDVRYSDFSIFIAVFDHVNAHVAVDGQGYAVVGYPEDIFYGETLYRRAAAEQDEALSPIWKDELSVERNIYRLRTSGMEWRSVFFRLPTEVKEQLGVVYPDQSAMNKLQYRFRKEQDRIGAEPFVWRKDKQEFNRWFRQGFSSRLTQRLWDLRKRAEAEPTVGEYAVAILSDDEALKEEFYNLFPQYRPASEEDRKKARAQREADAQAEAERRANLTDAQRRREDEKAEREARQAERRWRKYEKENTPDRNAWAAGTKRAEKVRLLLNDEVKTNDKVLS